MGTDRLFEDALANMDEAAQLRASTAAPTGKGGGGGSWQQRFTVPGANEDPAQIVLVPGEYDYTLPAKGTKPLKISRRYGILFRHYNSTKRKYCRCTAGLQRDSTSPSYYIEPGTGKCPSCRAMEEGAAYIQNRKLHVFNMILLDHFHLVDSDKSDSNGKPYTNYEECQGKRCKLCKKGVKKVFGRRMYWPLGPMHAGQLADIARKTLARNCACGGKISPIAFVCPSCQATLRDLEDEPFDTKKELAQFRSESHRCNAKGCGYDGPVVEIPQCSNCRKATPLGLFNTKLEVYMTGKGTTSAISVPEYEPLTVELKAKLGEDAMRPFNWDKVWDFKPLDPDDQAKLMGIDNSYGNYKDDLDDDDSGSSGWGGDGDEDDDSDSDVDAVEDDDDDLDVDLDD